MHLMHTTMTMTMVAAAFTLAACGGGKGSKEPVANASGGGDEPRPVPAGFRDGALWSCQISDYDPQPCKVAQDSGQWRLTKLLGSQRFTGVMAPQGASLAFAGEFYCPWGACTAPMNVDFNPDGAAGYMANFDGEEVRLRYDADLESEYGGAGYGGLTGREQ